MYKVSHVKESSSLDTKEIDINLTKDSFPFNKTVGYVSIKIINREDHKLIKGLESLIKRHLTKINKEK